VAAHSIHAYLRHIGLSLLFSSSSTNGAFSPLLYHPADLHVLLSRFQLDDPQLLGHPVFLWIDPVPEKLQH